MQSYPWANHISILLISWSMLNSYLEKMRDPLIWSLLGPLASQYTKQTRESDARRIFGQSSLLNFMCMSWPILFVEVMKSRTEITWRKWTKMLWSKCHIFKENSVRAGKNLCWNGLIWAWFWRCEKTHAIGISIVSTNI